MKLICVLRDINKAMNELEEQMNAKYLVGLNEAMVLCALSQGRLSATEIAEKTGMTASHCSKVIKSIEKKLLIDRNLGETDKRQMYFKLSKKGKSKLEEIKCNSLILPDVLKPISGNCDKE